MKKYSVLLISVLLLNMCACGLIDPEASETTALSTIETTAQITLPNPWPLPEDIELMDEDAIAFYFYNYESEFIYRAIFYEVPGEIDELRSFDGFTHDAVLKNEMALLAFIRHYNIKKEDFIVAVQRMYKWSREKGWNIRKEASELPNPDIIYTLDNEVINAYYRRENPVVPDWTKTKTYESYSAYLEENSQ